MNSPTSDQFGYPFNVVNTYDNIANAGMSVFIGINGEAPTGSTFDSVQRVIQEAILSIPNATFSNATKYVEMGTALPQ